MAPFPSDGVRPNAVRADGNESTLLRLGWMLAGNAALALFASLILISPAWKMTLRDVLYWLTVAGLIALRYADIYHHHGQTADGEPATPRHFKRYAIGLVAVAALVWAGCQSVQLVGRAEDGS